MSSDQRGHLGTEHWHVGEELLLRYAAGSLDLGVQSAIETHVTACAECRAACTTLAPEPALDRVWRGVVGATGEPRLSVPLRLLTRMGLHGSDAVILRASSNLHRPLVFSLAGAFVFGLVASLLPSHRQVLLFLLVAPLLPVLFVAAAYDATDPMRELAATTSFNKLRIALLRSAAALGLALPIALALGLALPGVGTGAFLWLLPSLLLTVVALNLLTWFSAPITAGAVAGGWLCVVVLLRSSDPLSFAANSIAQTGFAVATLLGLGLLAVRLLSLPTPASLPVRGDRA